jgi:hypothetical protein
MSGRPSRSRPAGIIGLMPSWRDSASQQCQDDLDALLNVTLPFARQMLDKSGELYPSGAAMSSTGETRLLAADSDQDDRPASNAILASLVDGIRQAQADYRAAACCSDVRLSDSNAVRVELEHQEGAAIAVLLPYKKKRIGRGVEFGHLRGAAADKQVWP